MKQNFRKLYGAESSYPALFIASKLYIASSKLLNTYMNMNDAHEDDIQTLVFYSNLALQRASVTAAEIDEVYKNRDTVYNKPYSCKENLTEADIAAFLVAKSLRMKNILLETGLWHKDSVIDFVVYLNMLREKLRLV